LSNSSLQHHLKLELLAGHVFLQNIAAKAATVRSLTPHVSAGVPTSPDWRHRQPFGTRLAEAVAERNAIAVQMRGKVQTKVGDPNSMARNRYTTNSPSRDASSPKQM